MKRLVGRIAFALSLLLLVGGVPTTLAAPMAGGPNYTHHMVETVPMSAALCARVKAAHPSQANNPSLCTFTHGVDWTDMLPLTAAQQAAAPQTSKSKAAPGMAIALSCPSGTASFHDFEGSIDRWYMDLVTTFAWYGNCAVPTITYLNCYVEYTLATNITNKACYQYTYPATNPNRRAGVYSGHIIEHDGLFDFTYDVWQRRECFNTGSSSCYWTYESA